MNYVLGIYNQRSCIYNRGYIIGYPITNAANYTRPAIQPAPTQLASVPLFAELKLTLDIIPPPKKNNLISLA